AHAALHSFPTRRSSDLDGKKPSPRWRPWYALRERCAANWSRRAPSPDGTGRPAGGPDAPGLGAADGIGRSGPISVRAGTGRAARSEEHTSELQSRENLV